MKHDERLVEAVARALWCHSGWRKDEWGDFAKKEYWRASARAALDAINDSGIAWLAPPEATDAMDRAGQPGTGSYLFAVMRDAYLAEQGEPK